MRVVDGKAGGTGGKANIVMPQWRMYFVGYLADMNDNIIGRLAWECQLGA